ncbi:metalloregulator ArsR/SmtB family transcription factor [Arthrobacter psychrolactophilus]
MVAEKVFAVIAESTRRDILEALAQESKAVGQLVDELGVSQPTVSKHLRVLREAGVVTMRAQGQKRFYGINTEPLALVSSWLDSLGAGALAPTVAKKASANGGKPAEAERKTPPAIAVTPVVEAAQPVRPAVKVRTPEPVATIKSESPAASAMPATVAAHPVKTTPTIVAPAAKIVPNVPVHVAARPGAVVVHSNDSDNGAQSPLSRSVGRAANKAADLLANLPTLPTFKRRKN